MHTLALMGSALLLVVASCGLLMSVRNRDRS